MADGQLQWESDINGTLGTGRELVVDTLSPGRHIITLISTDQMGATAMESAELLVLAAADRPEIAVEEFSVEAPAAAAPGEAVGDLISLRVINMGAVAVDTSVAVGFYLSDDPEITFGDTLLEGGREGFDGLAPGEVKTVELFSEAEIPQDVLPGEKYLGVIVDENEDVEEANEGNNTAAVPFTVSEGGADPIELSIHREGPEVVLSWDALPGAVVLEIAEHVNGPWEPIAEATPYRFPIESGPRFYFRLVR
jgi:hypothetical protein